MRKLDYVVVLSFASGVIFFIFFVIYRKVYLFYPCIAFLAITVISFFADIIMQKVQKKRCPVCGRKGREINREECHQYHGFLTDDPDTQTVEQCQRVIATYKCDNCDKQWKRTWVEIKEQ